MKRPDSILANLYYQKVPKLPKFQSKGQVNIPGVTDFVMPRLSNESTSLGTKIDEAAIRQAQIDRQRQAQGQIKKAEPKRSAASKALAIATHPMTALAYKVKGQDIPENFEKGERNILDNAVDIVNPFSYVDQARQVKEDINQGNYLAAGIGSLGIIPGEGAFERGAGKFLHNKKRITLDDFESTINYHLGEGLGIKKNPTNLRVKVRPGDLYPEIHAAENAPKFTVDLYNEGRHSGFVGLDKLNTVDYNIPGKKGTIYTKVADYPYEFSKLGKDALKGSGISGELNKALTNALQEYDLGKLYSSTVHTDEGLARWKNLVEKGKAKEVAPNRFELYKQGGIIKDDRGQLPKAQNGLNIPGVPGFKMTPPVSESTAHFFYNPILGRATSTATTGQSKENIAASTRDMGKAKQRERDEEKQRVAERKAAKAIQDGKTKTFTFPTGETKSLDQMNFREREYVAGKSLESRGRINEDKEAWYDSVNPVSLFTDMAGALGAAPYEAQQSGSNMPYVSAIANPLVMGRMMGSGSMNSISKKFWTNEVSNAEFLNSAGMGIPGIIKGATNKVGQSIPVFNLSNRISDKPLSIATGNYLKNELVTKNMITPGELEAIRNRELAWLDNPEYIKRRMAATRETPEQVAKAIQDHKDNLNRTSLQIVEFPEGDPTAGEYAHPISGPTIRLNKFTNRDAALGTYDHEVGHVTSQVHSLGQYPGYPRIKVGNPISRLFSKNLSYYNQPYEQQVRFQKLLKLIEDESGIPRGQKITPEIYDAFSKQLLNSPRKDLINAKYDDVGGLLALVKNKYKSNYKPILIDALNKSYLTVPGALGIGAALEQKKDGGNIKLGQNMTVTTEQLEELKRQGYKIQML